jgi:hypothetical protein
MTQSQPANTFPIKSLITIVGVPAMNKLRVDHVSDGCVTVYGKTELEGADHGFTISGSSPAIPYHGPTSTEIVGEDGSITYEITKARAPRGSLKNALKNPTLPGNDRFTVAEFAETNSVPYPYALKWVKENCKSAGFKDKVAGKRGKSAELFSKISF